MLLNYELATQREYMRLLEFEAFLVSMAERLAEIGDLKERSFVLQEKKRLSIKRTILKAVLKQKEKAASAGTLTAIANS